MDRTFFYSYIHVKVKNLAMTNVIEKKHLKEIIGRIIVKKGGVPKFMVKYLVEDMTNLQLIKKLSDRDGYLILENPKEKEIKNLIYLGDMEY
jgi:hypothetical protein